MTKARDAARFAVAPMMDWTDSQCRQFHRVLTKRAQLFTEMVTSAAVVHGKRQKLLGFCAVEHPLVLQLGGSDPKEMADAALIAQEWGYDEVNINVGCPSDRVQSGRFGACLMQEPKLVGELVGAMRAAVSIPVTVKCRIGVDDQDPEHALDALADNVFDHGCAALWVHARKAWLDGLSPKENRDIPPLDYHRVYRLKERLPDRWIGINGGLKSLQDAQVQLRYVDGVMLGRAAYQSPMILANVDAAFFGDPQHSLSDEELRDDLVSQAQRLIANGGALRHLSRHLVGLYQGVPGARQFRRHLAENTMGDAASPHVLVDAFQKIIDAKRDYQARLEAQAAATTNAA